MDEDNAAGQGYRPQLQHHQRQLPQGSGTPSHYPRPQDALATSGAAPVAQPAPRPHQYGNSGSWNTPQAFWPGLSLAEGGSPFQYYGNPFEEDSMMATWSSSNVPSSVTRHTPRGAAPNHPLPNRNMDSGNQTSRMRRPQLSDRTGSANPYGASSLSNSEYRTPSPVNSNPEPDMHLSFFSIPPARPMTDLVSVAGPPRTSRRRSWDQFSRDIPPSSQQPMSGNRPPQPGPSRSTGREARYQDDPTYQDAIVRDFEREEALLHATRLQRMPQSYPVQASIRRSNLLNYAPLLKGPYTVASLLKKLQPKILSDLFPDEQLCPVCDKRYEETLVEPTEDYENAIELPCGHVFGHWCLAEWMRTRERDRNKVDCPMCRVDLLETPPRLPSVPTPEQLSHLPESDQRHLIQQYRMHRYRCEWDEFEKEHGPAATTSSSGNIQAQAQYPLLGTQTTRRAASSNRASSRQPVNMSRPGQDFDFPNPASMSQPWGAPTPPGPPFPGHPLWGVQAMQPRQQPQQGTPGGPPGGVVVNTARYNEELQRQMEMSMRHTRGSNNGNG